MSKNLGRNGEKIARKYAKKAGMKILETNCRAVRGEIDLIARDKEQIVFIEVKTNSAANPVPPESRVNSAKQRQIGKIARAYLQYTGKTECDTRFDVMGITFLDNGDYEVSHIRDAFWIPGDV